MINNVKNNDIFQLAWKVFNFDKIPTVLEAKYAQVTFEEKHKDFKDIVINRTWHALSFTVPWSCNN